MWLILVKILFLFLRERNQCLNYRYYSISAILFFNVKCCWYNQSRYVSSRTDFLEREMSRRHRIGSDKWCSIKAVKTMLLFLFSRRKVFDQTKLVLPFRHVKIMENGKIRGTRKIKKKIVNFTTLNFGIMCEWTSLFLLFVPVCLTLSSVCSINDYLQGSYKVQRNQC